MWDVHRRDDSNDDAGDKLSRERVGEDALVKPEIQLNRQIHLATIPGIGVLSSYEQFAVEQNDSAREYHFF